MRTKTRICSDHRLVTLATTLLAAVTIATTSSARLHTLDRQDRETERDARANFAVPDVGDDRTINRGNVAAGLNVLLATITGELANTGWVNAPSRSSGDTWWHTASLGLSLHTPIIQPFVVVTSPLDDGLRGEIYEGIVAVKLELRGPRSGGGWLWQDVAARWRQARAARGRAMP